MPNTHYDNLYIYGKIKQNFFSINVHTAHPDIHHTGLILGKPDGTNIYVLYDHTLLKEGIRYFNSNPTPNNPLESIILKDREITMDVFNGYSDSYRYNPPYFITGNTILEDIAIDQQFPKLYQWNENHTEYDIPKPETYLEFVERIGARLFHLTQRIQVLRHEEPHQNALSENICREVPEDHDEVLRYDLSNNLIKRPVGWLMLQIDNLNTKYKRHLEAAKKAQDAGRTPPTFNDNTDRTKIENMLEKLETHLTEECLRDHFDLHNTTDWDNIHNKKRRITLCKDDATKSPGELIVDVNSFFTDGRGNIAETHAKNTYHEISTKWWVLAKRTPHRKLVTERTVTLS